MKGRVPLDSETWPRSAVVQYTDCELRQRVRHSHGLALLNPSKALAWRTMAYGILLERMRARLRAKKG